MTGYDGRGTKFPLTIVRGADMAFELVVADSLGAAVNLSAATIAGELYTTAGVLVDTMTAAVSGAGSNVVALSFTDTETALFTAKSYLWSLTVTRGSDKRPWLAGRVNVTDGTSGGSPTSGTQTLIVDSDLTVAVTVATTGDDSLGPASGTDDTARIQAALTAGGLVRGLPGESYIISDPLVIGSNTVLDMTGCTITLAASSACNMLIDSAHSAANVTVPSAVENVAVIGGIWDRGANAGTGNNLHSIILGGDNIVVKGITYRSSAGKYGLLLQNVTNFVVEDFFADGCSSDGVHIQGPASNGSIRNTHGTSGDDLVAITPADYSAYTFGNEQDVTDIEIIGVHGLAAGSRHVIVLGGRRSGSVVLNTSRIKISNVTGTQSATNTQPIIIVGDDLADVQTKWGQVNDVQISGVSAKLNTTTQAIISVPGDASSLAVRSLRVNGVHVDSDCSAVLSLTGKITNCQVSDVTGATTSVAITAGVALSNSVSTAAITNLQLSNWQLALATTGGSLVRASVSGHTLPIVSVSNVTVSGMAWVMDLITATSLRFVNCSFTSLGSGTLNVRAGAAIVVNGWSGCTVSNTFSSIAASTRSLALDFPLDITDSDVVSAKVTGDRCTTRSVAGGIAAGQPVVYDGALWYELASQTTY